MTLLLERGDIPGFKVGRRRRRHEKRGGAWVRGHRVSGLVQRRANRRCAALSRSVQRPQGARLSAMLGLFGDEDTFLKPAGIVVKCPTFLMRCSHKLTNLTG